MQLAFIKFCRVLEKICEKEIRTVENDDNIQIVIMATCAFEKEFSLTFLNIMTHHPIHLVELLFTSERVQRRSIYPIQRYMKTLKG